MATPYRYALGADIGGTNLRAGLVRSDGRVLHQTRRSGSHDLLDLDHNLDLLAGLFDELTGAATRSGYEICGAGIGLGCLVTTGGEASSAARPEQMPPRRVDLAAHFPRLAGLPLILENDSKAAAWGEFRFGAGRGRHHAVCITVGTGIGGGIILDGRLYPGAVGLAGHLGYLSVAARGAQVAGRMPGGVEAYASGTAIRQAALAAHAAGCAGAILALAGGDPAQVDAATVFTAAERGDATAVGILETAGHALGVAIASLLHLLNPEIVIIGGGLAAQGERLLGPVRRAVAEATIEPLRRTPIVPAQLGDAAGLVGAAALASFSSSKELS